MFKTVTQLVFSFLTQFAVFTFLLIQYFFFWIYICVCVYGQCSISNFEKVFSLFFSRGLRSLWMWVLCFCQVSLIV